MEALDIWLMEALTNLMSTFRACHLWPPFLWSHPYIWHSVVRPDLQLTSLPFCPEIIVMVCVWIYLSAKSFSTKRALAAIFSWIVDIYIPVLATWCYKVKPEFQLVFFILSLLLYKIGNGSGLLHNFHTARDDCIMPGNQANTIQFLSHRDFSKLQTPFGPMLSR